MLAKAKSDVLWRMIAEDIESQICKGELAPGARLATEHEFARRYRVNRHTVRRALADLQTRGLIAVSQGRGSFVRRPLVSYRLDERTRLGEAIHLQRSAPAGRDLSSNVVTASLPIAHALDIAPGAEVVEIQKMGVAGDQPVALSTHYLPVWADCCPEFLERYRAGASIEDALESCGVTRLRRCNTRVSARLASPGEMAALDVPRHAPLLVAESLIVDPNGKPIEFNRALFASDRVEIVWDALAEAA